MQESDYGIPLGSRMFSFTKYQVKRYILFNAITLPVSTLITLPYNMFVLQYSFDQLRLWFLTGVFFSMMSSLVMTWVSMRATHFVDRHIDR